MLSGVKERVPNPRTVDKAILMMGAVLVGLASVEFLYRLFGLAGRESLLAPLLGFLV